MAPQLVPAVLPRQTLTHPATAYCAVPVGYDDLVAIHIAWFDGTSNATITLQTSSYDAEDAPVDVDETDTGNEHLWADEGDVTVVGPSAAGAGCSMLHLGNFGAYRARLKIVTVATTDIEIIARRKGRSR